MNPKTETNSVIQKKNFSFLLLIFFITSSQLIFSQTEKQKQKAPEPGSHQEIVKDAYIPVSRDEQERSPAYNYRMSNVITKQVNVDANGLNIVGDAANEPSIAVDPNNRNRIAIGWRQFNTITSNFRQAGYGYSTNGGMTWTFPGVIEPGVFRSDPVLQSDAQGNFYYNSLTNVPDYFCHVFKSTSGGASWGTGVPAKGGDKQWMVIDKSGGPGSGNIYAYWTKYWSTCFPGFFTRSANGGLSYEDCTEIPQEPYWGTLAVNSSGDLYVGATGDFDFVVARSVNAKYGGQTVVWDLNSAVNLDGTIGFSLGPNPGGLAGQTNIAVDTSGGPHHNNVYLLCTVSRYSVPDSADVMFARSTNGGSTWSAPKRINDDIGTSAFQWFGTMSVAPDGRIDVIWLDTRDHPGTYLSALYYSRSNDGGVTWSPNVRISEFFDPHAGWPNQNKMGDYFDMISDSSGAHLSWAATFTGGQDVYYSYITGAVVPVQLASFSAYTSAGAVMLEWSTVTETNNRGFEVQRSSDKIDWVTIAFKEGAGTTQQPRFYSYTDKLPGYAESKVFYRIRQVDFNGTYELSEIAEITVAPKEFALAQNYPNPFNPLTTISYQIPDNGMVSLKVYDVLGNVASSLVDEYKSAGSYEIDFNSAGLSSGVYFYTLKSGSASLTKKMILLK